MVKQLWRAIIILAFFIVLCGLVYPLAVTGLARVLFPKQARGSLVAKDGGTLGSNLIGQTFSSDRYFHGRPSAAGTDGYDAAASSGSNLGPTNKALLDAIARRAAALRRENGLSAEVPVPGDLVTASASGLDPDISPEAAYFQAARVARARHLPAAEVRALVARHLRGRQLGILGQPRVNVLELNMALDALTAGG